MGKSTAAQMFREAGMPVFDSDAAVHTFYRSKDAQVIANEFPDALVRGEIDRQVLSRHVVGNPENMRKLEAIVHPVVAQEREQFIQMQKQLGFSFVVLDIPLLFEIGGENTVDAILVVSASDRTQRQRALNREEMTAEKFEAIKAKQISNVEKKRRAHFIVCTESGFDNMRLQIGAFIRSLR